MEGRPALLPHQKHAPVHLGRVLILGLGKSGMAAFRYCSALLGGRVEGITVAGGDASEQSLTFAQANALPGVEFYFDTTEVAGHFGLCIASPGISQFCDFYQNAARASEELISELEFAWRESAAESIWVAVTGTNGKSTTTALIAHLLASSGIKAIACGNIGDACSDVLREGRADIYVAEVSSYQLASTLLFAPQIAVLLNISPDHLSWHKSHEAYVAAKMKVFENLGQVEGGTAILDATDEAARHIVKGFKACSRDTRGFDYIPLGAALGLACNMVEQCGAENGAYLRDGQMWLSLQGQDHCFGPTEGLQIRGRHNVHNALAAAVAAAVLGLDEACITQALAGFTALEHRIEPCGSVAGVACYNDSKATNSDATIKALSSFGSLPLIVLLGGRDKGCDLEALVCEARRHCKAIVCFGEVGPRILEAFVSPFWAAFDAGDLACLSAEGLEDAFEAALGTARAGDVILLSPACASFDEFDNFEHRGRVFKDLVARRAGQRGA